MQNPQNSFRYLCGFQQWMSRDTWETKNSDHIGCDNEYFTGHSTPVWMLLWAAKQNTESDPWTFINVLKDFPSHQHFLHHIGLEKTTVRWDLTAFLSWWMLIFLLLGQNFNITWWERLSPQGDPPSSLGHLKVWRPHIMQTKQCWERQLISLSAVDDLHMTNSLRRCEVLNNGTPART